MNLFISIIVYNKLVMITSILIFFRSFRMIYDYNAIILGPIIESSVFPRLFVIYQGFLWLNLTFHWTGLILCDSLFILRY